MRTEQLTAPTTISPAVDLLIVVDGRYKNLERFQKLIDESTGEAPDKQLLKLQAEEVAKDHLLPKMNERLR